MADRERGLFSIGAVSRMLDLSAATIRTWETRYAFVVPDRSAGGQRLYSRDQVDQLRFVKNEVSSGRRPGEAHRLLAERLARGDAFGGTRLRVLVAESHVGVADVLRELLGADAFEVVLISEPGAAERAVQDLQPSIVVVDTGDSEFSELGERLRDAGVKIVPIDLLARPLALLVDARASLT